LHTEEYHVSELCRLESSEIIFQLLKTEKNYLKVISILKAIPDGITSN